MYTILENEAVVGNFNVDFFFKYLIENAVGHLKKKKRIQSKWFVGAKIVNNFIKYLFLYLFFRVLGV